MRYVCGVRKYDRITSHRLRIGWASVEERRRYFSALLLYKIIRMEQPPYLAELFRHNENRTSARSAMRDIRVPESRTDVGLYSFRVQGAKLWNSIPSNIKFLPS